MKIVAKTYENFNLNIQVWDDNNLRANTFIGENNIVMSDILNTEQMFTIDIYDKKNIKAGKVKLILLLAPPQKGL